MRDFKWNLTRKAIESEVKVCQIWESNKIKRNLRKIEVIVGKVELLEVDGTIKPTTTEIKGGGKWRLHWAVARSKLFKFIYIYIYYMY